MRRFVLAPEAEHDLDEIKTYLISDAGPNVARHVLREIRSAIRFLAATPDAGHYREDLTGDDLVKFWPVFSYLIVYDPIKRPIEVVRILHGRRDVAVILEI